MTTIAVLGLGAMGSRMAANLLKASQRAIDRGLGADNMTGVVRLFAA